MLTMMKCLLLVLIYFGLFVSNGFSQSVVSETVSLIKAAPDANEFKGNISVEPEVNDCHSIDFNINVSYTAKEGLSESEPFGIFYPGIQFKFSGKSCLPAKSATYTAMYEIDIKAGEGSRMGIRGGKIITTGPVNVTGSVSMLIDKSKPVFEVIGSADDPLVLLLTEKGFKYVSGKGSVKVSNGKTYQFQ